MKRKVVKHGPATYIVSLPSNWVKKYNIKKGDELEVEESERTIIISTEKGKKLDSVTVDITNFDRTSIIQLIKGLYTLGYDEIDLNFKKQSIPHFRLGKERTIISVIHEAINRLSGIEIIQQRKNSCILKTLSEMSFTEFEVILRRAFLLLIDMHKDMIAGAKNKDEYLLDTLKEKRNTITKFLNLCMRLLNKKGYKDSKKTIAIYNIILLLEKIIDLIIITGRSLIEFKPDISLISEKILQEIQECIEEYYHLFYKFDDEKIVNITKIKESLVNMISKKIQKLSKQELLIISRHIQIPEQIITMIELRMAIEY